ncbi:MAG: alpha/beta fold hydrolase [Chloroflexaceae bacterium]|jgi:phospholipase/carboxylesterase|nr:alpha/beta fold hydrolase [Chloroflexaceae bacterium]
MSTTIHVQERPPQQREENRLPPLLLLLHGYGSNEEDLMGLAPYLDPRFHIVSARAIFDMGYGSYAWYHLSGVPGRLRSDPISRLHALEVLTKFLRTLPERTGTDPQRVCLLGFSQGAILSLALALTAPELLAGVVAASGMLDASWLPNPKLDQLEQLRILLVHGTQDEVIPVVGSQLARDFLTESTSAHVTYRDYPAGHTIHPQELRDIQAWLAEGLDDQRAEPGE